MQCEKCAWTLLNAFPFTNKNCSCAECLIEELVIQLMVNKIENIRLHSWDSLTTDRNHMILVMRSQTRLLYHTLTHTCCCKNTGDKKDFFRPSVHFVHSAVSEFIGCSLVQVLIIRHKRLLFVTELLA